MEYGKDNDVKYLREDETQQVKPVRIKRNTSTFLKEKYQMI
jgi:hypothetical protein